MNEILPARMAAQSDPAPSQRPTLEVVAARAGVSKATASKVLNNRDDVSAATRAKVQEAMKDLHYVPSTGPRARPDHAIVTVVVETLHSRYASELLQGILSAGLELHTVVAVASKPTDAKGSPAPMSESWLRSVAARGHRAIIVVSLELSAQQVSLCAKLGLAIVVVDPLGPLPESVTSVGATNWTGGLQATEHLLELGHRRIAYAGGSKSSAPARERLYGFRSAMENAGAAVDATLVRDVGFTYDAGLQMGTELLALPNRPTAIFAGSDPSAMGVLEAARRIGLRVPEDLSVVGFDDTQVAAWSSPPLTTVRQPLAQMGWVALRTALRLASERPLPEYPVQLATTLVVRASTAPPAPATHR
jgi:LacI family transcriptional regulator